MLKPSPWASLTCLRFAELAFGVSSHMPENPNNVTINTTGEAAHVFLVHETSLPVQLGFESAPP